VVARSSEVFIGMQYISTRLLFPDEMSVQLTTPVYTCRVSRQADDAKSYANGIYRSILLDFMVEVRKFIIYSHVKKTPSSTCIFYVFQKDG
jgi:hypothetical protein